MGSQDGCSERRPSTMEMEVTGDRLESARTSFFSVFILIRFLFFFLNFFFSSASQLCQVTVYALPTIQISNWQIRALSIDI